MPSPWHAIPYWAGVGGPPQTGGSTGVRPALYEAEFDDVVARERYARNRLARARRELHRSVSLTAMEDRKKRNRAKVIEVRDDLDRRVGRDVTMRISRVPPASYGDIVQLATLFNRRLMRLLHAQNRQELPTASCAWFRLFRFMDNDDSGRISYRELELAVREEPMLSREQLPETKLQSLWKALDENASGFLCAGEFGRFMRKGQAGFVRSSQQSIAETKRRHAEEAKQMRDEHHRRRYRTKAAEAAAAAGKLEEEAMRLEAELAEREAEREVELEETRLEAELAEYDESSDDDDGSGAAYPWPRQWHPWDISALPRAASRRSMLPEVNGAQQQQGLAAAPYSYTSLPYTPAYRHAGR